MESSEARRVGHGSSSPVKSAGGGGIEEASPDALRNTPSNIARLEDVIEHTTARQKYLAQTRSASDGGDVRWYFCKVPLAEEELAASVPRTEIVRKGDYLRFGMRDSLAIEASFLQSEDELLTLWWKEYAECSEGPWGLPSTSNINNVDSNHSESSRTRAQSEKSYDVEEERVGVPVKGGLYEVDLACRHSFPVYWNGENRRVLRGHWFARKGGLDWLPIREDVAEQLEVAYRSQVWHRRRFQPSGLFAARVDLQGSTPGLHALFTGEDDTWEAWLHVDSSGLSSVIPLGGSGVKLRRGYSKPNSPKPTQDELRQRKEEEMDDYCSQVPVQHLVFMVHGIGQRLAKSNLVDDVTHFRHITESMAERHLTSHQRGNQRVLYIPCQWRKGLKLSGESAVDKITLDGVRGLRVMLGATVHDILYYMSPVYCQDIINSVSKQLNRLYLKFLKRNPGYNGKVSIYGHSLGSVLSYDILCHQENFSSPFPMEWMYKKQTQDDNSRSDQSLKNDSPNNQEDSAIGEIGDVISYDDDGNRIGLPSSLTHKEDASVGNAEDTSAAMSPISSDFGEEDMDESVFDLGESKQIVSESTNECGRIADESREDENTNKIIESLQKEIDLLRAKVEKFESKCNQENEEVLETATQDSKLTPDGADSPKSYTPHIRYTKLEFKVDTFFAVGSPLGVFLALRNVRIGIGRGQDYWAEEKISNEVMPACQQMFNIFHPFDPVAYRVEPLVCKDYVSKRPVTIPYHKGGKRLYVGYQDFTENLAAQSQAIMDRLASIRFKILTVCESRKAECMDDEKEVEQVDEQSYGSFMMERLTGSAEGRIDHMLQDETFRHAYLSAIGSHTNYWRDYDTALFILKHLYRDIPEDPNSPEESDDGKPKAENRVTGWSDQRDSIEELPLTFSDKSITRSFSNKAKKFLKKR